MRQAAIAIALLLAAGSAAAQDAEAPFVVEETGEAFDQLQAAVDAIGDGDGTIAIAPGRYRQCAVQDAGRIAYVARRPGTAILDGRVCEGKAALVLRGRAASVSGLIFQNIAVRDGNGAGIRLQQGDLHVVETLFRDSQSGILSHDDPSATIRIEQSTFSGLGYCGNDCAHSIYIGDYGRVIVNRSRFERGTGGHYVKSRSARTDVADSSFDDSGGRATNYMIDLPSGGTGLIAGNMFVQGREKENYSAMIVVAAEGARHRSAGLSLRGNRAALAPGARPTTFVVDFSGEPLAIEDNQLDGDIARFERR